MENQNQLKMSLSMKNIIDLMYLHKVEKMKSWEAHLHRIIFESFPHQVKKIRVELLESAKKNDNCIYFFKAWFRIAFQLINAFKYRNTIRSTYWRILRYFLQKLITHQE